MKRHDMSRRKFLALAGSAGAYAALGPQAAFAMRGMGMGMGNNAGMNWSNVIDPPVGEILRNPPDLPNQSQTPGLVEVSIDSKVAQVNLNGMTANLYTYNGSIPGPTLRVKRGDRLKVNYKNSLPVTNTLNLLGHERDATNLHTHGFHVSPMGNSDNVMLSFKPGQNFVYEYDLTHQYPGSMCFYHPHVHGTVSEQYFGGQSGAILVDDGTDVLAGYPERVLVLKDFAVWNGQSLLHNHMDYMRGKEGPLVTVNGQINPRNTIRPGEVQRWRIVNASNARFYNLSLEGHQLHFIGTDAGPVDKPYPINRVLLSPGERIDVLIKASGPGNFRFLSLPYNRGGCGMGGMGMGGMGGMGGGGMCMGGTGNQMITLLTMTCEGSAVKADIPPAINREAKRFDMNIATLPRCEMVLSMHMHLGFINGKTFGPDPFATNSKLGTFEIWDVYNRSPMDHPLHYHVNSAQVLAINGGDPEYATLYTSIPCMKDTVIVPKFGSIRLLMPVFDWPGMSMMHCHIIEHEDIGMMGAWNMA